MQNPSHINLIQLLQSHRRGEFVSIANAALEELIAAMKETGGDGTLTITLPIKHAKKGPHIEITPKVTLKKPDVPVAMGIYYLAEDEDLLSRRDPAQLDIEDEIQSRREAAK
ncbi:MAG: hypothetical protein AAGD43_02525 [Pseudomonadota bacterium]